MNLPAEVERATSTYLALADDRLPGLVEGLYLHGSLGFGEFHPARSDIDFVAVVAERPDAEQVSCSARCWARSHGSIRGRTSTASTSCGPTSRPSPPAAPTSPASTRAGSARPAVSSSARSRGTSWRGTASPSAANRCASRTSGPTGRAHVQGRSRTARAARVRQPLAHPIVVEALRIRESRPDPAERYAADPATRITDLTAFSEMVIEAGLRLSY